jgi:F-type H+-transporting ATPase subunit delta
MIRRFARPYARALMEAAGSPKAANAIRGELMGFAKALSTSEELRTLYGNPGVPAEQKTAITNQLAKKLKISELGTRFLNVLVDAHRINDLDAVLAAIHAYVNRALGVEVAHVRTARTLSADEMEQLARVLGEKSGRAIELDVRTDPTLLGGFVAQVGSEIYDASVVGKINKFKESLT